VDGPIGLRSFSFTLSGKNPCKIAGLIPSIAQAMPRLHTLELPSVRFSSNTALLAAVSALISLPHLCRRTLCRDGFRVSKGRTPRMARAERKEHAGIDRKAPLKPTDACIDQALCTLVAGSPELQALTCGLTDAQCTKRGIPKKLRALAPLSQLAILRLRGW
jgi:hypothetical protein